MYEYRVQWRRSSWSATTDAKSRTFSRLGNAQAFIKRLRKNTTSDQGELRMWLSWREVGGWSPGLPGGAA